MLRGVSNAILQQKQESWCSQFSKTRLWEIPWKLWQHDSQTIHPNQIYSFTGTAYITGSLSRRSQKHIVCVTLSQHAIFQPYQPMVLCSTCLVRTDRLLSRTDLIITLENSGIEIRTNSFSLVAKMRLKTAEKQVCDGLKGMQAGHFKISQCFGTQHIK